MANYVLGQVLNLDAVTDRKVHKVAANVNITKGLLVYQDGANGLKPAPTDGSVEAAKIRVAIKDANNTGGALGDKWCETVKSGAIVVVKAQGNITVDTDCMASETTAGSIAALPVPASPGGAYVQAEAVAVRNHTIKKLCRYLAHVDEGTQTGKEPTNATDGQSVKAYFY